MTPRECQRPNCTCWPTCEAQRSPEPLGFAPIWGAIKGWDIKRENGTGYHGPTGDDVRSILAALDVSGFVVVPREPTEAMMAAVECVGEKRMWHSGQAWLAGWAVMIAAAEGKTR